MSLSLFKEKNVTIALLMTAAIFMADLLAPLWYDVWVLYLVPLFFMYRSAKRPYVFSAVVTLLIVTGLVLHPDSTLLMHSAVNRITGVVGGWGVSVLLMRLKHLHVSLLQSHNELEKRVIDLKELQDLLSQGKKEWEETFDSINDAITVHDRDFNVIRANKAAEKILGLPFLEILGQKCYRLYHDFECPPENCVSCMVLKTGKPSVVEKFERYLNKYIEIKAFPLFEDDQIIKLVHVIRDITERKQVEKDLLDVTVLQSAILYSADYTIISTDPAGTIRTFNKAAERLLGYSSDEVIGKATPEIFHSRTEIERRALELTEELATPVEPGFEVLAVKARLGISDEKEWTYVPKEGTRFPVLLSVTPLHDTRGKLTGFLEVAKDITERKRMEEALKHQAYHDFLTGLPNRLLFMEHINLGLTHARRNRNIVAILFLDLDRFKYINDTLGHSAGDDLLKDIAGRLRTCIRASDMVARMGGDEFAVLLSDIAVTEDAAIVGRKIIDSLLQPFLIKSHKVYATASIGISIYPDDSENVEDLLKNADIAMYHAKEQGGNTYQFYKVAINIR